MAPLTSGDVREFLRDYAEYNILLNSVDFTEDEVQKAMEFAVDKYNLITPVTSLTVASFPNRYLLLIGTTAHLMRSQVFLQLRNEATYRDGDVENIGIDSKAAMYSQLASSLSAEWSEAAAKIKQQENMEGAYDSLSSGYRYLRAGTRNIP